MADLHSSPYLCISTRPSGRGGSNLEALLAQRQIPIWDLPLTALQPCELSGSDHETLRLLSAGHFACLVISSAYAVDCLSKLLGPGALSSGQRVAVVGARTAARAQELLGRAPDFVPQEQNGRALAQELAQRLSGSAPLLIAGARELAPGFSAESQRLGLDVQHLVLYASSERALNADERARLSTLRTQPQRVAWLCYSPSAVRALARLQAEFLSDSQTISQAPLASSPTRKPAWRQEYLAIGPSTLAELELQKLSPSFCAREPNDEHMLQLIEARRSVG